MHKINKQSLKNKNVKNGNKGAILETKTKVSVLERISIALITISMFILVVSTFALLYLENKPTIP